MRDLDIMSTKVLDHSEDISIDHPGFRDPEYRKRRKKIVNLAKQYRWGDPLPHVEYNENEKRVWHTVYSHLKPLYEKYACKEYRASLAELEKEVGYTPDSIPQLESVSKYLEQKTDWVLRPVTGLLSPRDFLNSLALKVFQSTQYVRHHKSPWYTPEPCVAHELLGHAPMFADPDFAAFSHELGLASLGATDDEIGKLATLYWWTVEYGLVREPSGVKIYGAGLLSSYGECEFSVSREAKHIPFKAEITAVTPYTVTEFQRRYFVADSFASMTEAVRRYAKEQVKRSFNVAWDAIHRMIQVY